MLVVAIAGLAIFLHTSPGRAVLRDRLERELATTFANDVRIGALEGSPLGTLIAREVVIAGPDGAPAIEIARLEVEVELGALIRHRLAITTLAIDDLAVHAYRMPDGSVSLAHLLRPGPRGGWPVEVRAFAIRRGRFELAGELHLDRVELAGSLGADPASFHVTAEVAATWRERAVPVRALIALALADDGLAIPVLHATIAGATIDAAHVQLADRGAAGLGVVHATPQAVTALVPGVALPAPGTIAFEAGLGSSAAHATRVELAGRLGAARLAGALEVWPAARRVAGSLHAPEVALGPLTGDRLIADAGGSLVLDLRLARDHVLPVGTLAITGELRTRALPATELALEATSDGVRVTTTATATNPGLAARLTGVVESSGERLVLAASRLTAHTRELAAAGLATPVRGALDVELTGTGALRPRVELAVAGTVFGRRLAIVPATRTGTPLRLGAATLAIDGHWPARPRDRYTLVARELEAAGVAMRELEVDAARRADATIAATLHARPGTWRADADVVIRPGTPTVVELRRHVVRIAAGARWRGNSGRIAIAPDRIEVRDLASTSEHGALSVEGSYRSTGDLAARIAVTDLDLATVDPRATGIVELHLAIARRAGGLHGEAELVARGLAHRAAGATIDGRAHVAIDGARLVVEAWARADDGLVSLDGELVGPRRTDQLAAWRRLDRSAIVRANLGARGLELGAIARALDVAGYGGRVDGELALAGAPRGELRLRRLVVPGLTGVDAELRLASSPLGDAQAAQRIGARLDARIDRVGALFAAAELAPPAHVFDPVAWRRLGRGAVHHATIRARDLAIEPGRLPGRLATVRGRVSVELAIDPARARLDVFAHELRGAQGDPLDGELHASLGDELAASFAVGMQGQGIGEGGISIPLSFDRLARISSDELRALPLSGAARLHAGAPRLLGVFGRHELAAGELDGSVLAAGTVGGPTAVASITGTGLEVPPGPGGQPRERLARIAIDVAYDAGKVSAVVEGTQPDGRLAIAGTVALDELAAGTLTLEASNFDVRPLLVFVPGPAGGATGRLDALLRVDGLELATMRLSGGALLGAATIPLAANVGTLRRASVELAIRDRQLALVIDGRLGGGTARAWGMVELDGGLPGTGVLALRLREVSPIGALAPVIDGDAAIELRRDDRTWVAEVDVRRGRVKIPERTGDELAPAGAPADLVVVDRLPARRRRLRREVPVRPTLIANVRIAPARIESEELRGTLSGNLQVTTDGRSLGLIGSIDAERGDLELFGRRYRVERAAVRFDGGADPLVDVRLGYEFPGVTTFTEVSGRWSKPELALTANPSVYSQGQLLGFLLGGAPTGTPDDARDRSDSFGASLLANRIGGYVQRALPIDVDVLRYEASSANRSAAITIGSWLGRKLFVAYRRHLEARPDENSGEGELEYWLSPHVVIDAVVGDRDRDALDLLWRRRY